MRTTICGALAALLALAWSVPAWASPELSVAPEGVSIAVPAGGRVTVVGLMRRSHGPIPGFARAEVEAAARTHVRPDELVLTVGIPEISE